MICGMPLNFEKQQYLLRDEMRRIHASGAISLRAKKIDKQNSLVMVFRRHDDKETENDSREVRRMLGLNEEVSEFRVIYGSVPEGDGEITLMTRSILEILSDISSTVEVPSEHVAQKRVHPTAAPEGEGIRGPMVRIHSTTARPGDYFAAVPYRDQWFWIDDRDYASKRLFSFLMFLMTLTETGSKEGVPIVTINAGGVKNTAKGRRRMLRR